MAKKLRKAREMRDNVTSLLVYFPSNAGDGWGCEAIEEVEGFDFGHVLELVGEAEGFHAV
jgi:hypothetical protein